MTASRKRKGRRVTLPPNKDRGYVLEAEVEEREAWITLGGNVGLDNSAEVAAALAALRKELARAKVTSAVLDLRGLFFLASSGLKQLVSWVTAMGDGSEHRYTLQILTDPGLHWQKRSLAALASLEPDLVRLQEQP